MRKKFYNVNLRAIEAKARRDAVKQDAEAKKQKAIEDEFWRDDDKNIAKKQKRREEKEKKRIMQIEKKRESRLLLDAEISQIKTTQIDQKITQQHMEELESPSNSKQKQISEEKIPIQKNLNCLTMHDEKVQSIDDAVNMLKPTQFNLDKHTEKRLKAAYNAFQAENLPKLRTEYPSMRLSQVKQILHKNWAKSPNNPTNQKYINKG